jgi:hypothetical protein
MSMTQLDSSAMLKEPPAFLEILTGEEVGRNVPLLKDPRTNHTPFVGSPLTKSKYAIFTLPSESAITWGKLPAPSLETFTGGLKLCAAAAAPERAKATAANNTIDRAHACLRRMTSRAVRTGIRFIWKRSENSNAGRIAQAGRERNTSNLSGRCREHLTLPYAESYRTHLLLRIS